ncbi:hypothetical protein, partial [Aeromonas caviae]|uniref:hypothetical protein n=1 Tax=Aeromonas caviae TaxID=648 RepID=UPI002B242F0B
DVFGQLSGQCFEFVLVHLLTHEGILLKKLLIRGRLHNWIYRLTDHAFSDEKGCPQNLMNVAPATRTPAPNIATVTQRQKLACVASVFAIC